MLIFNKAFSSAPADGHTKGQTRGLRITIGSTQEDLQLLIPETDIQNNRETRQPAVKVPSHGS